MLLAIDVGNTNIAFGVHDRSKWLNHWRIRTVPDQMPDEYRVLFRELLRHKGLDLSQIDRAILCSVVPPLTGTLAQMLRQELSADSDRNGDQVPLIVGPGIRTGVRIRTDNPAEVGGDLVANAVAAHALYPGNCIVVDFGTALTFTAVDASGDLMGVAIAPGLNSAASALSSKTAQLPQVRLTPPPAAIGRNTVNSIQSGVVFGYVGLVESLLHRMRQEMGGQANAIATGGLSHVIAPLTDQFTAIEPWLTLDGLRFVADRNS
jgi:type III pantothenate kinase